MDVLYASSSCVRQGENRFSAWLVSGQHKMVTGVKPRVLFLYQISHTDLLAYRIYILKIARKLTVSLKWKLKLCWREYNVIEVPGVPVPWVIVASLHNGCEIWTRAWLFLFMHFLLFISAMTHQLSPFKSLSAPITIHSEVCAFDFGA